jgi:predicted nucleic acid-binding protein
VQTLLESTTASVALEVSTEQRGTELEAFGFGAYDALHLACAEAARADVFLTTDDALLHRAQHHEERIRVRVENPLTWLRERSER